MSGPSLLRIFADGLHNLARLMIVVKLAEDGNGIPAATEHKVNPAVG